MQIDGSLQGTTVVVELEESEGGTDLSLHESPLGPEDFAENRAGWVSVLLNLKARAESLASATS